jgi:hypothetical protein
MPGIEGPGVIGGSGGGGIPTTTDVVTVTNDTATLPNSRALTAGTNVTLDTTTPGELIVNATGGGGSTVPATVQGDTLFASAVNTLSALAKDANATRYVSNTGTSNNPAWAQVNLTNGVTAILPAANGGTANGFTAFSGPATSTKTFTLPNASATVLTSNAAVTVAQGGTGIASGTSGGIPYFSGTTSIASSALLTANALVLGGGAATTPATLASLGTTTTVLHGNAAGAPTFGAVSLSADVTGNLPVANLNSGTSASNTTFWRGDATWAAPPSATPAGSDTQVQFNNAGAFGADADFTWNSTTNVMRLGTVGSGTAATISTPNGSSSVAANLTIATGDGNGSNNSGGAILIQPGTAQGAGTGSGLSIFGAPSGPTGNGGQIDIIAGVGGNTSGNGGDLTLRGGAPQASGAGGSVSLIARDGVGTNKNGGSIGLFAGLPTGSGTAGHVFLVNMTATGAQTATFSATNKPGSGTTAPSLWWNVQVSGVQYYIPLWQ